MTDRLFAVVTGGGTGGHVSPALAVAEALVDAGHDPDEIEIVGGKRGIESTVVPAAGFRLHQLPGRGIQRRLTRDNLGAALGLAAAVVQAVGMVARRRPAVVVSVGGYAGFPYAFAAAALRVPLVVVNVDAVPGAANRVLGRLATVNAVAFEGTPLRSAVVTGPPVRRRILAAAEAADPAAFRQRLDIDEDRLLLIVTSGSLGASSINRAVVDLAGRWADRRDLAIYHVAGDRDLDWVRTDAGGAGLLEEGPGLQYRLAGFDAHLVDALAACDLAIARAGASTVAELTVMGVPSILVPLPGAPGDHQTQNALALRQAGAARLLPDGECTGERLAAEAGALLTDAAGRKAMSDAGRSLGRMDAAARVAALVDSAARPSRAGAA